jgi:hypothetical protein
LGNSVTISNLENKAHYSLKSEPIFKDPNYLSENKRLAKDSFFWFYQELKTLFLNPDFKEAYVILINAILSRFNCLPRAGIKLVKGNLKK